MPSAATAVQPWGRVFKRAALLAGAAVLLQWLRRNATVRYLLWKFLGVPLPRFKFGPWPLDEWIDRHREDAIDADMPIIDPHHHLWDPRFQPKGWPIPLEQIQVWYALTQPSVISKTVIDSMLAQGQAAMVYSFSGRSLRQSPFAQPYMGEEFLLDIENRNSGRCGHNVVKTVYVECGWEDADVEESLRPIGEARMCEEVNAKFPSICNGVVARANLCLPDVEKTLRALKAMKSVKGIRHSLAWCSDPNIAGAAERGVTSTPDFRRGFALLEGYGFSFDTWMFHEQLEDVTALAKDFPNTVIIVDHVAEPLGIGKYSRESTFPIWERRIRELAKASQNVHVKLSGLGMCRTGFCLDERETPISSSELSELFGPYYKVCLDAFGVERCLFASNFPVDKVSSDYTVLWNAFKLIVKDYSQSDKQALFYENARRLYRL